MEVPNQRRQPTRSPVPPRVSVETDRTTSQQSQRSSASDESTASSNFPGISIAKRQFYRQGGSSAASSSNASLPYTRASAHYLATTEAGRQVVSPGPPPELQRHRPRQHSQGYFEPSMPSASLASQSALADQDRNHAGLTASQIAAQAAASHHIRSRSQTIPFPQDQSRDDRRSSKGSNISAGEAQAVAAVQDPIYRNGLVGTSNAALAASAAFSRGPIPAPPEEKESKKGLKARFRPKHLTIARDRDKDTTKPAPSPNKLMPSGLHKVINASTTSLSETLSSNNTSLYSLANPSQSTIIPVNDGSKEKPHKSGLRQKLKLKDKDEQFHLPLSSANSNSRPVDANNPQSLYSFAPASPAPSATFAKSVSGLDLRHGGRALRERKKEEKAQAAQAAHANASLEQVISRGESDTSEWPALSTTGTAYTSDSALGFYPQNAEVRATLAQFGLNNMSPDDAWDFLKAKVLAVFEGEDVRIAVEDLNKLVTIHVQRCVQRRDPSIAIGDLEDLLKTGFLSLNHTLRTLPEERLIPHLVSMWTQVFGNILPYMQAVFLPLDQEFKGRGTVLTSPKMAAEFWGALPNAGSGSQLSSSPPAGETADSEVAAGEELEVRRVLLITYRDIVILPRYDLLKSTFSRLSLDTINASLVHLETTGNRNRGNSGGSEASISTTHLLDPTTSSYNSQSSTLLNSLSSGGRSRATSNLSTSSNPTSQLPQPALPIHLQSNTVSSVDFTSQSFSSPPSARPNDSTSSQVTETVGRMLQCLSVLCSIQSGDEAQTKMEELNRQFKLNWLGRGRTGRNRRGFVGTKMPHHGGGGGSGGGGFHRVSLSGGSSSLATIRGIGGIGGSGRQGDNREGSPTPTPTRQGTVSGGGRSTTG